MVRAEGRGRRIQWRLPAPREIRRPRKIPIKHPPLELLTRGEWRANPWVEMDTDIRLKFPLKHIRYTFTNTDEVKNYEEGIPFLQELQRDSQEKGYPDLMYNFLVGSDGMLYEGRGLDWKCTVFADPWVNSPGESINVAFIGKFFGQQAPWQFRLTGKRLEKWLMKNCFLHEDYEITPSICWPEDFTGPPPPHTAEKTPLRADLTPQMFKYWRPEFDDEPEEKPESETEILDGGVAEELNIDGLVEDDDEDVDRMEVVDAD